MPDAPATPRRVLQAAEDAPYYYPFVPLTVGRADSYNEAMALVFTFPCGSCSKRYSVYYPKALLYALSGSGTREMGAREDEEEQRSGAVNAARTSAEAAGNVWVDASQVLELVCTCGKKLDLNIMHHPRVPQSKEVAQRRQTGTIPFPTSPKKT